VKRRTATIALLLCPAATFAQGNADWVIVPGKRVGPIDAGASEARLVELFGARNVTRDSFEVEPGVAVPASVLFASDPSRHAVVLWPDQTRTGPESVLIRGERSGRTLVLRVEPDPAQRDSPAYQQALGDVELSSESDAMRALNPRVFSLMVDIATK